MGKKVETTVVDWGYSGNENGNYWKVDWGYKDNGKTKWKALGQFRKLPSEQTPVGLCGCRYRTVTREDGIKLILIFYVVVCIPFSIISI